MKTFTARDFNEKRQQIREAIKEGGCIVQFKYANREVEFEAVILEKNTILSDMIYCYENFADQMPCRKIAAAELVRVEYENKLKGKK